MKTLHLTLTKQWFDMIADGEKLEEYREIKPYWTKRFEGWQEKYDAVQFRNGYHPLSPTMLVVLVSIKKGHGYDDWGAVPGKEYYVIKLGTVIKVNRP